MTVSPLASSTALDAMWDAAEGRRVPGGPTVPDPPASDGADELTFGDVLSIINPLQHLPVVSSLYRWITGDTIKPAARVIGGALYGGPFGLVTAALNAVVEQVKGGDIGTQILAALTGDDAPSERQIAAGEAGPADTAPAPLALAQPTPPSPDRIERGTGEPTAFAAPGLGIQGRDLAFYQANAGRKLAPVSASPEAAPASGSGPRRPPIAGPLPASAVAASERIAAPVHPQAPDAPPDAWFAAAMMNGLDRYRAMQRPPKPRPELDISQ